MKRLQEGFRLLADKGIEKDMITDSSIITPSCGCGTMSEADAERVLDLNIEVADRLRGIYGR